MIKKCLVITMMLFSVVAFGQFKMEGELRPRLELRDGYKGIMPTDAESILIVSQRSRLGINYTSKLYTTYLSFQDVRVWGEEQINSNQINIGLHEAWVEFNTSPGFKIKIGRQVLKYDNERLIASTNWNQIGAKHDAVKLSYHDSEWELDLVAAINQSGELFFESPYLLFNKQYKNMGILWLSKKWDHVSLASLSIFEGLRQDNESTLIHNRYTTGVVAKSKLKSVNIDSRLFYQGGKKNNGASVSAYLLNLDLTCRFKDKNLLAGGVEIKSGNEAPNLINGNDRAFDILYGGKHKLNGLMDYFGAPSTTKGMGLTDIYFKYNSELSNRLMINLDYHYFQTEKRFQFEGVDYQSYLGSEIDLSCSITISPEINITNIFSVMIPTTSMSVAKGSEIGNTKTGYYFVTMLTFKPVFLKN